MLQTCIWPGEHVNMRSTEMRQKIKQWLLKLFIPGHTCIVLTAKLELYNLFSVLKYKI